MKSDPHRPGVTRPSKCHFTFRIIRPPPKVRGMLQMLPYCSQLRFKDDHFRAKVKFNNAGGTCSGSSNREAQECTTALREGRNGRPAFVRTYSAYFKAVKLLATIWVLLAQWGEVDLR